MVEVLFGIVIGVVGTLVVQRYRNSRKAKQEVRNITVVSPEAPETNEEQQQK